MELDFFQIAVKEKKGGGYEAYPDFIVGRSEDLMVRAKNFYAVWDEAKGLWSTDEYDVQRIVDDKLHSYQKENRDVVSVQTMRSFNSNKQSTFRKYLAQIGDNAHQLDNKLTFLSTQVGKKDYVSKRLPYDLAPGDISAWVEMVSKLYKPEARDKIEWFIGAIVSGDSKDIQKFLVLEGPPGAGKGTIINIVTMMFPGYITTFDAKALGSNGNQFAAAAFEHNPLVAIQHDGDLSKIEDNTLLNSIVSKEILKINQKFKPAYDARIIAALMMGTNKPVRITDSQSGIIRRLIDVQPTGEIHPPKQYHALMDRIQFELGHIAYHCLQRYKEMGKTYYSNYRPLEMMFKTNAFINFIELWHDDFEREGGVTAKRAWTLYKEYCTEANIDRPMKMHEFRAEFGNYFEEFHDRLTLADDTVVRSWYAKIKSESFKMPVSDDDVKNFTLRLDETVSLLNLELADYPAQYAKADGHPLKYWDDSERLIKGEAKKPRPDQVMDTYLRDLDPHQEHYVKVPANMLVIDFDLKDEDGNKSLERSLEAAASWPATYGELSKSGDGVHLHYYYDGDVEQLDPNYAKGIEVKYFRGHSALRRRLTRCNAVAIASISSGLPFKEKKRVLDPGTMKSAKALRELIARNLRKEIHPGTKPSIDFIKKILDDAYDDGLSYDVTDMRQRITLFANDSTNRALECLKIVQSMKWKSADNIPEAEAPPAKDERLVFYDVEIFPNLFVICWKFESDDPKVSEVVRMVNPKAHEVEALLNLKLIGFNVRDYDNHILWAAAMGFTVPQLKALSDKIIGKAVGARFGEAYKLSYADIFDYSTDKKSLKKWQVFLGLEHRELDLPWDEPVPEDQIMTVVDYCANDVVSTEQVHKYLQGDWKARRILADLSGLSVNEPTAKQTAAIVFGSNKNPQRSFVYTNLSKEFPGYVYDYGKSTYRGEEVGEGGYVYAEPGIYQNVVLLDIASMHPTTIGQLNLFGEYTPRFMDLVAAQLAIKNGRYDDAKGYFEGKLTPYIDEIQKLATTDAAAADKAAADLRWGLKIAINIVYGLTSAKFDNPFKDFRNVDNIVAKRGALFMIDLKHYIQEVLGKTVVHIKTDSVKVPGATEDDIREIQMFGEKYGYTFELEAIYEKFALLNDAVYVAKDPKKGWSAKGTQFIPEANPYVFKSLFGNKDDINFMDVCLTKSVKDSKMYLDFGFDGDGYVNAAVESWKAADKAIKVLDKAIEKATDPDEKARLRDELSQAELAQKVAIDNYDSTLGTLIFIGKTGRFTPVKEGFGGGQLYRVKEGKHYAVAGTKGYLWVDSHVASELPDEAIDYSYFDKLVDDAREDLEKLIDNSPYSTLDEFLA